MSEWINWFGDLYPPLTVPLLFFMVAVIGGWFLWAIDNILPKFFNRD